MFNRIILVLLLSVNLSSCVTYMKNENHTQKIGLTNKFKSDKLKIYFVSETDADLQNIELFRELILSKNLFSEVLLVRSDKIETCDNPCVLFKNKKSGLSIGEKVNMLATYLTLGIIPSRFTNEYQLKNKNGQVQDIEIVNWISLFLIVYAGNDSAANTEHDQLVKLQNLLTN